LKIVLNSVIFDIYASETLYEWSENGAETDAIRDTRHCVLFAFQPRKKLLMRLFVVLLLKVQQTREKTTDLAEET